MINNYVFIDKLGEGTFGKVMLAAKMDYEENPDTDNLILADKKRFAVKILKKSYLKKKRQFYKDSEGKMKYKDAYDKVKTEIAIMKRL